MRLPIYSGKTTRTTASKQTNKENEFALFSVRVSRRLRYPSRANAPARIDLVPRLLAELMEIVVLLVVLFLSKIQTTREPNRMLSSLARNCKDTKSLENEETQLCCQIRVLSQLVSEISTTSLRVSRAMRNFAVVK